MYERVGTYDGRVPLQVLADRLMTQELSWAGSDYASTAEHKVNVKSAVYDDIKDVLPGKWVYSMIVVILPGRSIGPHIDVGDYVGLERRHLVLQTNDRCWNLHDGEWQQLELGGIYSLDAGIEHASINWGTEHRVHLVVDLETTRTGVPLDASVLV